MKPFSRANSSVSSDASIPTTGEKDRTISVRVSSLLSATFDNGLAVDDRPKRASDRDDLPFGELDRERMPDNVLDLALRIDGLAGRNGRLEVDVSGDSSVASVLVFRTSSVGKEESVGG